MTKTEVKIGMYQDIMIFFFLRPEHVVIFIDEN